MATSDNMRNTKLSESNVPKEYHDVLTRARQWVFSGGNPVMHPRVCEIMVEMHDIITGIFTKQVRPDIEAVERAVRDSVRDESGGHSLRNDRGELLWFTRNPVNITKIAKAILSPAPKWDVGTICLKCNGYGTYNDAEPGDIFYNTYKCKECNGNGGTGLSGKIYNYLKTKSMGHDEVDAVAIAALSIQAMQKR